MASITIPSIVTDLQGALSSEGANAVSAITSFFSGALIGWGQDEAKILYDAVTTMINAVQNGSTWEDAATAAYNEGYNEEVAEGSKIALQFLNLIASIAQTASTIL